MVKWITIALDDPDYFKFKEKCRKNNKHATTVLRELIKKYVNNEVEL